MRTSSTILRDMAKRLKEADLEPLSPLIEEYMIKRRRSKKRLANHVIDMTPRPRPPGRLSPSKICGCNRAAVFSFTGVPGADKTDWETELIFENGDWFHHKWQALFLDMEIVLGRKKFRVVGIEIDVSINYLYIAGSLDVHIQIKVDGKWVDYIVDIKSINSYGFDQVYRNQTPVPAHVRQVVTYAKASDVDRGILFYENKNDNRVKAFAFTVEPGLVKDIEEWCEDTISHLENKTIPPMALECQSGTFLHEKCPYSKYCHGKKTDEQLINITYKRTGWPGLKKAWKRGKKLATVDPEE